MNNSKTKLIALLGVMSAFIFVLLIVETQVLNGLLPVTPCYLSLPIAISLSIYAKDYKTMVLGGLIFGCCSFILSFIFGLSWFMNPLISILPRVVIGITATLSYKCLSKIFAKSKNVFLKKILSTSVSGIIGAITNTVLVVLAFYIFGFQNIKEALLTILSFNALIEIICSAILVPVITNTIRTYFGLHDEGEKDVISD